MKKIIGKVTLWEIYILLQSYSLSLDQTGKQRHIENVSLFCTVPILDPKAPFYIRAVWVTSLNTHKTRQHTTHIPHLS